MFHIANNYFRQIFQILLFVCLFIYLFIFAVTKDQEGLILEHPLEDILVSEEAVSLLPITFHDFLQTVSDLMLVLPHGGALQRMALQCWSMKFRTNDHMFLHQSHVFSNINRILSKSDEAEADQDQKVVKRDEEVGTV